MSLQEKLCFGDVEKGQVGPWLVPRLVATETVLVDAQSIHERLEPPLDAILRKMYRPTGCMNLHVYCQGTASKTDAGAMQMAD